jgi:cytochrome c oxidase subunit 2
MGQDMKRFIVIAVLVVACTFLVHSGLEAIGILPVRASAQAISIDQLFGIYLWAIPFVFSLIIVPLTYSLIMFRRKKGETGDGVYTTGNSVLEVAWTIIPWLAVFYLAYLGGRSLSETRQIDPSAMVVKVVAQQWSYQFQYPQYLFASKDLYLPVNQQVDLQMTSLDVIHSFYVPEFRLKQDILPGRTIDLRVTPTVIGHYHVECSQLCGRLHSQMTANVFVVSQAEFTAWVNQEVASAPKTPELIGQQLVSLYGCTTCHSTDGSRGVGPTWIKLYNSTVTLSDGSQVKADDNYLNASIVDPNKQIVQGFSPNVMPDTFGKALSSQQVQDIIAYIQTLK